MTLFFQAFLIAFFFFSHFLLRILFFVKGCCYKKRGQRNISFCFWDMGFFWVFRLCSFRVSTNCHFVLVYRSLEPLALCWSLNLLPLEFERFEKGKKREPFCYPFFVLAWFEESFGFRYLGFFFPLLFKSLIFLNQPYLFALRIPSLTLFFYFFLFFFSKTEF